MTIRFVTVQLFRVGHLPTVERRDTAVSRPGTPALLVTSARESHVMLLTPGRGTPGRATSGRATLGHGTPARGTSERGTLGHETPARGTPRGIRVFGGTHVVAHLGERADRAWYEVADVLVTPHPGREVLGRYP
ncbi:hypothetical protein ACFQ08_07560, partial [Streptosporangium algeriense]